MNNKLKNDPVFLITALCIFFPIGIVFLLRSELKKKVKFILGAVTAPIFIGLLSLALIHPTHKINPSAFQINITRETLSPGQSGGLIVTNNNQYMTDYTVTAENDTLTVNGSVYTAEKAGKCTLTVRFLEEIRTVEIEVTDTPSTNSIILASPTGERYHLPTATHAGKKAVQMTEEDALMSGKTPCKTCYK